MINATSNNVNFNGSFQAVLKSPKGTHLYPAKLIQTKEYHDFQILGDAVKILSSKKLNDKIAIKLSEDGQNLIFNINPQIYPDMYPRFFRKKLIKKEEATYGKTAILRALKNPNTEKIIYTVPKESWAGLKAMSASIVEGKTDFMSKAFRYITEKGQNAMEKTLRKAIPESEPNKIDLFFGKKVN